MKMGITFKNSETFFGMKFTKIYVFLGLHQTFKLKKNTIFK